MAQSENCDSGRMTGHSETGRLPHSLTSRASFAAPIKMAGRRALLPAK